MPVDAVMVSLHPKKKGLFDIQSFPNRDGNFVLKNVRLGSYSLGVTIPGRILSLTLGSQDLAPDRFRLYSIPTGKFRIVVSLKTSSLLVTAQGLPAQHHGIVALLAPADRYLTLRRSCYSLPLKGPTTEFRHVPPGRYRLFIIDQADRSQVSAYAPRFADFLKKRAPEVEVLDKKEAKARATYVDAKTVRQAIRLAGPVP